jgi:hypothetical protein
VFLAFAFLAWTRRVRQGPLEVDDAGLYVGGELVAPRDRVERAWVQPHGAERPPTVLIEGPGLRLEVESPALDVGPCRRLVRALGFAPEQRAMRFPLWQGAVVVGADGVWIDQGDAEPLFRPWPTLASLRDEGHSLVLGGSEGEVTVRTEGLEPAVRAALAERIEAMLEDREIGAVETEDAGAELAPLVLRGSRSVEAWIADLADAGKGGGYRGVPLDEGALVRAALDPHAAPELRAGAALALRVRASDEDRARLRVAAEAAAAPLVRVALVAASEPEGEPSDLARLLETPRVDED